MLVVSEIMLASVVFLGIIYVETRLLYNYKNHSFGINYMNITSFLPSWSKSFGVGLNFNIRL